MEIIRSVKFLHNCLCFCHLFCIGIFCVALFVYHRVYFNFAIQMPSYSLLLSHFAAASEPYTPQGVRVSVCFSLY